MKNTDPGIVKSIKEAREEIEAGKTKSLKEVFGSLDSLARKPQKAKSKSARKNQAR